MEFLKELFSHPLSYDEFVTAVSEKGYKLVDLSKGEYVAKGKLIDAMGKNKTLTDDIKKLNDDIAALKDENSDVEDYKKKFNDLLQKIEDDQKAEKARQEDVELTNAITEVFGDKKFTSDYVKNGIIADMKAEIAKPENKGKSYAELFESLTKDKDGIFANPNPPVNIAGINQNIDTSITKEQFAKMGYAARNELFNKDRALYNKLNEE